MSPMRGTAAAGGVVFLSSIAIFSYLLFNSYTSRARRRHIRKGLVGSIGNTPLIRISSLSHATGCEILGKAEFLNPGGSVKDRVALKIIQEVTYYFKITTYYYSLSQKYHLLYFYNAI